MFFFFLKSNIQQKLITLYMYVYASFKDNLDMLLLQEITINIPSPKYRSFTPKFMYWECSYDHNGLYHFSLKGIRN